jgi:F0F1-type ATP synthase assembly protein I
MSADVYANMRVAAWRDALRVLAVQAAAVIVVAGLGSAIWGWRTGLGALIGAAIGLLANAYLAVALLGKPLLSGKPSSVVISWLIRVGLTLSLLIIAMRANFVPPLSLIAGLAMVSLAQWLAVSFWLSGRR